MPTITREEYQRLSSLHLSPKRNKYNVAAKQHRTCDGILFASRREMHGYEKLKLSVATGSVKYFLRQVPLHLPGNTKYTVDFLVFWADGRIEYQDYKGFRTKEFIRAKKQVEAIYPITILEL